MLRAGPVPERGIPAFAHVDLPNGRGKRFWVPLGSRSVGASACASFNALRPPKTRLARRALAAAFHTGLAPQVVHAREVTLVDPNLPLEEQHLALHLADVLDEPGLTYAVGLGRFDAWWKPVLQLFAASGAPIGFAKVGWNPLTRSMVAAEADALERLDRQRPTTFDAPGLVLRTQWHELEVVVTAPLPRSARRVEGDAEGGPEALAELSQLDGEPQVLDVVTSPWWAGLTSAVVDGLLKPAASPTSSAVSPTTGAAAQHHAVVDNGRTGATGTGGSLSPSAAPLLEAAAEHLDGVQVPFGRWHGDWVVWNMATADRRLQVWDWEYSAPGVPVGLDRLHAVYQHHHVGAGEPVDQALSAARAEAFARRGSAPVGAASDPSVLPLLHALELVGRSTRARLLGAPVVPDLDDLVGSALRMAAGERR